MGQNFDDYPDFQAKSPTPNISAASVSMLRNNVLKHIKKTTSLKICAWIFEKQTNP